MYASVCAERLVLSGNDTRFWGGLYGDEDDTFYDHMSRATETLYQE
jgi:hypothetical protein